MQQVAVGGMQLYQFNSQAFSAPRAINKGLFKPRQIVMAQRFRCPVAVMKCQRGWGDGLPSAVIQRQLTAAKPGGSDGGFAPGMPQLDSDAGC